MPADTLARFGNWPEFGQVALVARLNAVANELHVTASALKWRLVALGALTPAIARGVPDAALRHNGRDEDDRTGQSCEHVNFQTFMSCLQRHRIVSLTRRDTNLER